MAKKSLNEYMQKRTSMQLRKDDAPGKPTVKEKREEKIAIMRREKGEKMMEGIERAREIKSAQSSIFGRANDKDMTTGPSYKSSLKAAETPAEKKRIRQEISPETKKEIAENSGKSRKKGKVKWWIGSPEAGVGISWNSRNVWDNLKRKRRK